MQRKASAIWRGGIKNGEGELSTESGALSKIPYSFSSRFNEGVTGTNPEELIGAAHSGCFAMALAGALEKEGFTAESLEVSAAVSVEKSVDGFTVTSSKLNLRAKVPSIEEAEFKKIAEHAKETCPISKLLNTKIELAIEFHSAMGASRSAH